MSININWSPFADPDHVYRDIPFVLGVDDRVFDSLDYARYGGFLETGDPNTPLLMPTIQLHISTSAAEEDGLFQEKMIEKEKFEATLYPEQKEVDPSRLNDVGRCIVRDISTDDFLPKEGPIRGVSLDYVTETPEHFHDLLIQTGVERDQ